jgi:hypothetical protein
MERDNPHTERTFIGVFVSHRWKCVEMEYRLAWHRSTALKNGFVRKSLNGF